MSLKPVLLQFRLDNFASLPSEPDLPFYSEVQVDCNEHEWYLAVCPGGSTRGRRGEVLQNTEHLRVYMVNENDLEPPYEILFTYSMKDANGDIVYEWNELDMNGEIKDPFPSIERSRVIDASNNILLNGALRIDVTIQVKDNEEDLYYLENNMMDKMLKLFRSGEKSDVVFKVGTEEIRAHSLILHAGAPIIASYIDESQNDENCNTVVISDMNPEVFRLILEHVYSAKTPKDDVILKRGKELLNAANKFELPAMKMHVENRLVQGRIMNKRNVSDWILFADSHSCPLLKEHAIFYFLLYPREILRSEHSKRLRESGEMLSEIIMLMSMGDDDSRTVNDLRWCLDEFHLDADGSRETLLARLKGPEADRERAYQSMIEQMRTNRVAAVRMLC